MQIQGSNYQQIVEVWQRELWPERQDIEPYSWMKLGGGHYTFFSPLIQFWKIQENEKIVAVLSAHSLPDSDVFRLRGLWVHPEFRGKKLASRLFEEAFSWAKDNGGRMMWTYPREAAWPAYRSQGFISQSEWLIDQKGQRNCYAVKNL